MELSEAAPSRKLHDAAITLLKRNIQLKPGESVLLITDRKSCSIFTSIAAAASQLGAKLSTAHITSNRQHSASIPFLRELCLQSEVIIGVTDKSISHSPEITEARNYGARVVSMPGITEKLFINGVAISPSVIKRINLRLMKKLENCKEIKVISPTGTFVSLDLSGSSFDPSDNGDASYPNALINLPYGEIYSLISKGNGKIVIDIWKEFTSLKKAVLEIENGKIIGWNNAAAPYVINQLNAGECGLYIAELGIGTNPMHKRPIGITLYDEKIFGSVHFAFGSGKRKCEIHEDFVILNPTVLVDGEELIKRGKFLSLK